MVTRYTVMWKCFTLMIEPAKGSRWSALSFSPIPIELCSQIDRCSCWIGAALWFPWCVSVWCKILENCQNQWRLRGSKLWCRNWWCNPRITKSSYGSEKFSLKNRRKKLIEGFNRIFIFYSHLCFRRFVKLFSPLSISMLKWFLSNFHWILFCINYLHDLTWDSRCLHAWRCNLWDFLCSQLLIFFKLL